MDVWGAAMIITGSLFNGELSVDVEPGATTLIDTSPFRDNLTFLGDGQPDWVQLPSGLWYMLFDGANDYVAGAVNGNPQVLERTADMTFIAWFNVTLDTGDIQTILGSREGNNDITYPFWLGSVNTSMVLSFRMGNGALQYVANTTTSATPGQWHMASATIIGTAISVRIDAGSEGTVAFAAGTRQTGTRLTIGSATAASTRLFTGGVAPPLILDYGMEPGQLRNYYEKTKHLFGRFD